MPAFVLGLTGSIGMGKSTTAGMFVEEGIPVWDADASVDRLYEGGAAVGRIGNVWPDVIREHSVDRAALRRLLADDPDGLSVLEAIVHPLVEEDRQRFIRTASAPIIVVDIPLLFETGAEKTVDAVAVVSVPPDEQEQRVMARPGMTKDHFEMIRARQLDDSEKRKRADYVIDTGSFESARKDVQRVLADIKERIAHA